MRVAPLEGSALHPPRQLRKRLAAFCSEMMRAPQLADFDAKARRSVATHAARLAASQRTAARAFASLPDADTSSRLRGASEPVEGAGTGALVGEGGQAGRGGEGRENDVGLGHTEMGEVVTFSLASDSDGFSDSDVSSAGADSDAGDEDSSDNVA